MSKDERDRKAMQLWRAAPEYSHVPYERFLFTSGAESGWDAAMESERVRGLVKALEFYADQRNYVAQQTGDCGAGCCVYFADESEVAGDNNGDNARDALAKFRGEQ